VFSTGPRLDSGRITGCVIDPSRKKFQPTAALFRAQAAMSDSVVFTEPDYLTQADSAAFFSIENVRPGDYRLIAFVDKNSNHRLDPGSEDAFAPLRPVISVSPQAETVQLFPVASDTASPRLASVKPLSPRIIIGTFDRPLDTARGCSVPQWTVECVGDTCPSPAVAGCRWTAGRSSWALLLAGALANAPYRLIGTYRRTKDTAGVAVSDTARFNGLTVEDTVPPSLLSRPPSGTLPLLPEIKLNFSEPVKFKGPVSLADSLGDTVPLCTDTGFADTVILTPMRRLRAGCGYRLVLLTSDGHDIAGNPLRERDSTDTVTVLRLSVIAADSLALSLKGCASCLPAAAKRKWRFLPFSGGEETLCPDSAGCFSFSALPHGRGNIGFFIDENGNGRPDPGSLVPWLAPEASVVYPDTVEARARWEIEGVTFSKPCEPCAPHSAGPVPHPGNAGKQRASEPAED
jgi:uncharacterized protein (DUF2141 family)